MAKRKAAIDVERVRTRKDAAELLGVTPPALTQWTREPWFPPGGRNKDGSWNVPVIDLARQAASRKGSARSDQAQALKVATDAEKLKQHRIKTQHEELKLSERRRELFPRAGIELFAATFLTLVGDDLDQLPAIIAKDVPQKQRAKFRRRLQSELDELRRKWRDELEREAKQLSVELGSAERAA